MKGLGAPSSLQNERAGGPPPPRPTYPFTTIQLNKNYNAKMHVGGNNHGPSMIIGLEEYTGGSLWQYDPSGDYEMVVKGDMREYRHLKAGDKAKGRLKDIRSVWREFDGNAPHAALPFEGNRITIVYFTRKNWLNTREDEQRRLKGGYGFPLPEESYLSVCMDQSFVTATEQAVEGAAKRQKVSEEEEVARAKSLQEEAIDATNEVDAPTRQGTQARAPQSWGATRQGHRGHRAGPPRPSRQWPARRAIKAA